MTNEEIIEFCEMKAELEPENEDIYEAIIKTLEKQPSEDTEVIKVSKGAVKARQGRFVIYDVEWLKKNFYTTEEKIYGQPKEPCENCISKEAVDEYITNLLSGYLYDEERTRLEDLTAYIWELPPVTPQQKIGHWILLDECSNSGYYCSECHKKVIKEGWSNTVKKVKYCPNCGAKMAESEEKV